MNRKRKRSRTKRRRRVVRISNGDRITAAGVSIELKRVDGEWLAVVEASKTKQITHHRAASLTTETGFGNNPNQRSSP